MRNRGSEMAKRVKYLQTATATVFFCGTDEDCDPNWVRDALYYMKDRAKSASIELEFGTQVHNPGIWFIEVTISYTAVGANRDDINRIALGVDAPRCVVQPASTIVRV